jgi:ATP-dependent Clp endopeptidase proteolytic subunit ClpP
MSKPYPDAPDKAAPEWWVASETARMAAEASKLTAEAEAQTALAQRYLEETKTAAAIAQGTEVERDRIVEKRKRELADNSYHRVYAFTSEVKESSVSGCINKLTEWSRTDPGCEIELILNSPGGDVIAGFALIDFLHEMRGKGHKITTVALGMAASMAGVILQAGDVRVMGANALLLIHEASFGVFGSYGEVEDRVNMVKLMQQRILRLFADRSNLTVKQLEARWKRRDWWIDSEEALKHGLVDEVRGN